MSCRTRPGRAAKRTARPPAERRALLPAFSSLALALSLGLAAGCLSQHDEESLAIHRVESKHFYDFGDYERSEDQCRKGLEIAKGDEQLSLQLAFCLLMQAQPRKLDEAAAIFDEQIGLFGSSDWRLHLGAGMTDQERSRIAAAAVASGKTDPVDPDEVRRLREKARRHLEIAYTKSREKNENNAPPELLYHFALLDLDEGRHELFRQHAEEGVKLMQSAEKVAVAQLRQASDDKNRARTEHDRAINAERARLLLHELARSAWGGEPRDAAAAAGYMKTLEQFGPLARPDFFNRGRIYEATGNVEAAVADYEKFLSLSADVGDENVTRAVQSLEKLRSQLAEKRTASPAASR